MGLLGDPRARPLLAALGGALLVLAIAVGVDGWARHGISVTWYQESGGERVEIARTIEHRTSFPNEHRALSRYVQRWPFGAVPIPREVPRLDAVVSARVHVPESMGRVHFRGRSSARTSVLVDGAEVPPSGVGPGWHRLEVSWVGDFARHPELSLEWGSTADSTSPIPREHLVPIEGSWPASRGWLWTLAATLALLLAAQLWRIARASGALRRERVCALATALVILLGTGYRTFDYDVMPEYRENGDELFAMWNGWSILEDGTTRGWTLWPAVYTGAVDLEHHRFFGMEWHVISPYFEHPPALHVLTGIAAHLGGAEAWPEAQLRHGRIVPILLSALTLWLLIAVGRRLDPASPAPWLGALLYAALPVIALQTRVIKEEALLTPLALGATYFFLRWRDDGRGTRDLVIASVLAGLGMMTKVTGLAYVPALVMLIVAEKDRRAAVIATVIGLGVSSLFFVYGAAIDWDAFLLTTAQQGTRPIHFNIFLRWFDDGLINHSVIGRGWVMFLWLATMATIGTRSRRDTAVIAVPLVLYMLAISIGSGNWTFGWYAVPMYPYVCLGGGRFLADAWKKPDLLRGAIFVLVCVLYSLNFTIDVHWAKLHDSWTALRRAVPAVVAGFLVPFCLVQVWPGRGFEKLARLSLAVGIAVVVVLAGAFVAEYDTVYEEYRNFDRDVYFDR